MFRILIYPKETIEDLLSKGSILGPLAINCGFAVAMWAAIDFGTQESVDSVWFFMEALFGSAIFACTGIVAIVMMMVVGLHIIGEQWGGKGSYTDMLISYTYSLIPFYTGLLVGTMIPKFFWALSGVYLAWSIVLGIKLIGYAHELDFNKSFLTYILSHSVVVIFVYIPTIMIIMGTNLTNGF